MPDSIPSIVGVHVDSGPYAAEDSRDFELFMHEGKKPHRVSVIFGHNGSGKSTIAREISAIAEGTSSGYLFDENQNALTLGADELNSVRVFSEDYIAKKIRLEDDGLQAIVMLGDQANAKDEIDRLDTDIATLNLKIDELESLKNELEEGPSSIDQLELDAKEAAKNGGWSSRGQSIKNLSSKMPLNQSRWNSILEAATTKSRDDVEKQYLAKFENYQKAQASGSLISVNLHTVSFTSEEEAKLTDLLKRTLDEPILTDREQRILSLVQDGHQNLVETARNEFASDETTVCPMCQQDVSPEYKKSLEASIIKVLSKEADEYKAQLQAITLPSLQEEETPDQVSGSARAAYASAYTKAAKLTEQYSTLIEKRAANLYVPLNDTAQGLSDAISELNSAILAINTEIEAINEAFRNKETMERELLELSDKLAWLDAKEKIESLNKAKKKLEGTESSLTAQRSKKSSLESERAIQEARLKQVNIAADVINRYLACVYFDTDRFKLVPSGEKYAIQSHGKPVRPKDISTGERNILALCYFCSEGGENKPKDAVDKDPQYIILDDPISSFDMENRVGICSLIRARAVGILGNNPDSRITVLTHDVGVVSELEHTFEDARLSTDKSFVIDLLNLTKDGIEQRSRGLAEYTALIRRAYNFASSQSEDERESLVIGNILRRILEGYGTFNYGMGMAEISRDSDLCKRFGDNLAPMLESVMYRLELNDESHMQERLSSLNPSLNFSRYSYDEKRTCAQFVFVILNKLDENHVRKQLKDTNVSDEDLKNNIAEWEKRFSTKEEG